MSPGRALVDPRALARYCTEIEALATGWKSSGESVRALGRRTGVPHPTVTKILEGRKRNEWSKVLPVILALGGNEELIYSLWCACFEPSRQVGGSNLPSKRDIQANVDETALATLIASGAILRSALEEAEKLRSKARDEYEQARLLAEKILTEAHATLDSLIDEAIQTASALEHASDAVPTTEKTSARPQPDVDALPPPPKKRADKILQRPNARSSRRSVPNWIPRPEYVGKAAPTRSTSPWAQPPEVVEAMRIAGGVAAQALAAAGEAVRPGVATDEIDRVVQEVLVQHGAYPSILGFRGFPKSCTVSLNEVVCHGVPGTALIGDGDIIGVDVAAFIGGVHAGAGATFLAGRVETEDKLLVECAREATLRAIKAVKPGREVNVIGRVIEAYARRFDYGVIRDFSGHGIGPALHNGRVVLNYDDPSRHETLEPGMTFTVEPMITRGGIDYEIRDDGWTVATRDRSHSALFKHTIVVTESGAEILTRSAPAATPVATGRAVHTAPSDDGSTMTTGGSDSVRRSGLKPLNGLRHPLRRSRIGD